VQQLQCRNQTTSHPANQFQLTCQLLKTVTQFQKPGARDANNSNPVSNSANGNKILHKKIQTLHKWRKKQCWIFNCCHQSYTINLQVYCVLQVKHTPNNIKSTLCHIWHFHCNTVWCLLGYRPDLITLFEAHSSLSFWDYVNSTDVNEPLMQHIFHIIFQVFSMVGEHRMPYLGFCTVQC